MKRALAVTALVAAVAAPSVALGWAHNGLVWPEDRFPLPIHLKPAPPEDTDLETIETIVQDSLAAWNAVSCSFAALEYAGIDDLPIQNDDDQVFAWSQDAESWVYGSSSAGATIIDVTAGYPRVDILFNDIYFDWVVGANTVVTAGYEFGVDPPIDVDPASVITHEVGHLLGLAHPNPQVEGSQPDALATMVFALLPNAQQSSLAADDKLGLCARYPAFPGDECGEGDGCGDHECELFTAVDRNTDEELGSAWLCDEVRGTYGDFCSVDAWICAGTCLPTRSDYSEGYCTDTCEAVEDCPSDPFQWDCREFPIVGGDPIFLCVAEEAVGEDTGIGIVDAGPSVPDAGAADADEPDTGADASQADATTDPGADAGADTPDGDSGGGSDGCASTGRPTPGGALAWLALAAVLARRRR